MNRLIVAMLLAILLFQLVIRFRFGFHGYYIWIGFYLWPIFLRKTLISHFTRLVVSSSFEATLLHCNSWTIPLKFRQIFHIHVQILTLKMNNAKVVETSVNINKNSPFEDSTNVDDLHPQLCNDTPGFKPFTLHVLYGECYYVTTWQLV